MKEKSLKHLSFGSLLDKFRSVINVSQTVDSRDPTKTQYEISDAVISGFACMYFQDPSLLYFQRRMEEEQERSNLKTIFGVKNIPKDTQFRTVLDKFDPECFAPVFKDYFLRLQRGKHLEQYRFLGKHYLLTMDGTQYFCSENICCDHCLETTTKRGENEVVHHSHQVLQVALVHPDIKQVIPLMPEEISNTDGSTKQDCEWNAAKRQIDDLIFFLRPTCDAIQSNILIAQLRHLSWQPSARSAN